jgi:DNA-binding GntR family transcriptional regulator
MDGTRRDPFTTAYEAIRGWLAADRWRAGDKLNLVAIAHELKLSPTPVREAVSRLVGEDLVEYRRAQGYFMPHLLVSEIEDLYWLLEGLVVQAIARLDDESFSAAIRASLPDMDAVADRLVFAGANAAALRIAGRARSRLGPLERFAPCGRDTTLVLMSASKPFVRRAIHRHFAKRRSEAAKLSAMREREDERVRQIAKL